MLEELLRSGFEALGIGLDSRALERYRIYYEYLEEMNKVMNLTAISGEEDVARLHFLDCVQLMQAASFAGKRVIDVGTGAGFPGLALKIACPDMELTLLDSLDEKYRTVLLLYYGEGFTTPEIARILHLNQETVKTRLKRARASFRLAYEAE